MFTAGRYVIVDDQIEEIRPLVEALHSIGAPCVGLHYQADKPPEKSLFAGVRLLFLDLHLIPGTSTGGGGRYGPLATLLETCIHEYGGPYVVILWTSHIEEEKAFTTYLGRALTKPHQHPLEVLSLDKNKYRLGDGTFDAALLKADVEERLESMPQLQALLSWEGDVLAACGAVLSELVGLIPKLDMVNGSYSEKLDEVLSQLAAAAVGVSHVEGDERGALNDALGPILQDKVMNSRIEAEAMPGIWARAITRYKSLVKMGPLENGRMNRMLHLACPPGEACRATDWGAVVTLPSSELTDTAMVARFGQTLTDIATTVFLVETKNVASCTPCLIRIGAVCDYAQAKEGPLPFVFGFIVPETVKETKKIKTPSKWSSPVFELPPHEGPVRIFVNARLQVTITAAQVVDWPTACRVREQLLMALIGHAAEYVSRPGIISLPNG